ncbi:MAG: fasciclin domain-containing protein, partial [Prolixibacteraceae bacterium]|nr:fasciclin domain-containing protein [Prolixibacteraceae bacterium]
MRKIYQFVILLLLIFQFGCKQATFDNPKYQRPDWLAGKLYSQAKADEDLSIFVQLLDKTTYSKILDRSGYFTLFAPTNEAMNQFFANNSLGISNVNDLSEVEAEKLVRYLIIQDGWTNEQLQDMGPNGFGEPTGYKRETLYPPYPYIETGSDHKSRYIVQDNYRHVPLFYKKFFDFYGYRSSDYEYFFPNQVWDDNAIYYAGAKILGDAIPSENGFLYKIDRMVTPLQSLDAITRTNSEYSLFHDLCEKFAKFTFDEEATNTQAGASEGAQVDSLWQKGHDLYIDLDKELIKKGLGAKDALVNNYTVLAPNNTALNAYLQTDILKHYKNISEVPDFILKMIINAHLRDVVTFPSSLENGVTNGEHDIIDINPQNDVVEKQFATNGTFYGLSKVIKPRALNSVLAPLLLNKNYEWFSEAIN